MYDEKSCIGTSSPRASSTARVGQRRRLDARQRVQVAALRRRIGLGFARGPQILETRLVGAARRRGDDDVEQVRVDVAGVARDGSA